MSTTGVYSQVAGMSSGSSTGNPGTFTNAGQVRIGEGTSFSNFSSHELPVAQYVQQASGTTKIDGTFQNNGARVENAGSMTIGSTGTYTQVFNKFVGVESTTVNTGTFTNNSDHSRFRRG